MPRGGTWVYAPDSGGVALKPAVKERTEARIRRYAEEHFAGMYSRLDIRFRGQFCYIDAYTEPEPPPPNWPPPEWGETREQLMERLRSTPTHLCRLRYHGREDEWSFAFYTYSGERYETAMFPSGDFRGRPEDAFQVSAAMYLR
jgi:hypothetical protein